MIFQTSFELFLKNHIISKKFLLRINLLIYLFFQSFAGLAIHTAHMYEDRIGEIKKNRFSNYRNAS